MWSTKEIAQGPRCRTKLMVGQKQPKRLEKDWRRKPRGLSDGLAVTGCAGGSIRVDSPLRTRVFEGWMEAVFLH